MALSADACGCSGGARGAVWVWVGTWNVPVCAGRRCYDAVMDSVPPHEVDAALPTARLRRQHLDLYEMANGLLEWRTPADIHTHAAELARRLARFVGALQVHAAMEEKALYPRLLEDEDAGVVEQARGLLRDVAPIYQEVFAYAERWRRSDLVMAAPEVFLKETKAVVRRLSERVTRETMELYPLADARLSLG